MKKLLIFSTALLFVVTVMFVTSPQVIAADQSFITVGTGGMTGMYYLAGGAICRLVNKTSKEHGIRCTVESTGGSIYNLNSIASAGMDMGVVQSDWQYHDYHGTDKFEKQGPNKDLRSVFSIHQEQFTVVAREDSGIKNIRDLKGKRVNIGNPGSGNHGTMEAVMDSFGWTKEDFKLVSELKVTEQSEALCGNKIDAMVTIVGHPSGIITESTTLCDSVLVKVTGPEIDQLLDKTDYYRKSTIPGGTYKGTGSDTHTFGMEATFVSSIKVSEETIYIVVKSVFEGLEEFKRINPVFARLKKEEMVKKGLSAPLHDGAKKYYKEVGLLN
jgi:hypothetical protein